MNNAVEQKETISFDEFKAWMNGLLRGKGSQVPDLADWRIIKKMMDKVIPDTIEQQVPIYTPVYEKPPCYPDPWVPWCGASTTSGSTSCENIPIRAGTWFDTESDAIYVLDADTVESLKIK